ncbi:hypothetical protein OsJ_05601 [Oryza sativa Japonica Group]|uniref:CASP-like protein n=1 Tax=Oryza sativa subsp. japonica TaxID=39947 RepID=A3A3R0_ORYSJ|nr:hypothetical protein OsJ_05601 [Oryza sativa Japonica Group]
MAANGRAAPRVQRRDQDGALRPQDRRRQGRPSPLGCAYVVFASTAAALQACMVGLIGVEALQWSKLCNIYTRFCEQAAAGMLCSFLAAAGMAVLSAFSARRLFRLYSPAGHRRSCPRAAVLATSPH